MFDAALSWWELEPRNDTLNNSTHLLLTFTDGRGLKPSMAVVAGSRKACVHHGGLAHLILDAIKTQPQ